MYESLGMWGEDDSIHGLTRHWAVLSTQGLNNLTSKLKTAKVIYTYHSLRYKEETMVIVLKQIQCFHWLFRFITLIFVVVVLP